MTRRRDLLLAGLTFSTGAVDAIVFLALGKVFTAFQTGNLVFLGIALADAGGPDVTRAPGSLAVSAAGVRVAPRLVRGRKDAGVWPADVSLMLSLACLVQIAFAIVWI